MGLRDTVTGEFGTIRASSTSYNGIAPHIKGSGVYLRDTSAWVPVGNISWTNYVGASSVPEATVLVRSVHIPPPSYIGAFRNGWAAAHADGNATSLTGYYDPGSGYLSRSYVNDEDTEFATRAWPGYSEPPQVFTVALTISGSEPYAVYSNGVYVNTHGGRAAAQTYEGDLWIGGEVNGISTVVADGVYQSAFVFNRVLSAEEIHAVSRELYGLVSPKLSRSFHFLSSVSYQYARPDTDISAGGWLPSSGSDLYAMVDETTPSDSDFIYTFSLGACEVALSPLVDPGVHTDHVVKYRAQGDDATDLAVSLKQGSTTIASWTETNASSTVTTYTHTLTTDEAEDITDYTDLRLAFEAA
jgi:hypothetical protein